jgi:hypothetical protein
LIARFKASVAPEQKAIRDGDTSPRRLARERRHLVPGSHPRPEVLRWSMDGCRRLAETAWTTPSALGKLVAALFR